MIMVGIDYPLVSLLEQSLFPIFPHVWSELDEQALLVLQGSSSQRMLSAYGTVCVVLWVTLDAIFQNVYETVVMQFLMVSFCDLCRHSIFYFTSVWFVWLSAVLLYSPLMEFKLF